MRAGTCKAIGPGQRRDCRAATVAFRITETMYVKKDCAQGVCGHAARIGD